VAFLVACSDDVDTDSSSPGTIGLHLFQGWTAEVPISAEVRSIAFENCRGTDWERIYTVDTHPGQNPPPLPVHIFPGVDPEREVVYAIVGFRGAYRVPDALKGKLVWNGVEEISEGSYQLLALETDDSLVPCVRVITITKSESGRSGD
jgi:hypothetical protein